MQLEVKIEQADTAEEAVAAALRVPISHLLLTGTDALVDEVCFRPRRNDGPHGLELIWCLASLTQIVRLREDYSTKAANMALLATKLTQAEATEEQLRSRLTQLSGCLDDIGAAMTSNEVR